MHFQKKNIDKEKIDPNEALTTFKTMFLNDNLLKANENNDQ